MNGLRNARAQPGRQRRGRDDRSNLAKAYEELYARIPPSATTKMLAAEFADKELRIIMSQNGILINNYNPDSGRYTEKTKIQKIEALLSVIGAYPAARVVGNSQRTRTSLSFPAPNVVALVCLSQLQMRPH